MNTQTGEGYTCEVCGRGFTQAEWDDRHDSEDSEDGYYHAECCPVCADDAVYEREFWAAMEATK